MMEQLKLLFLNICIVMLITGLIRSVMNDKQFNNGIRFVMNLLFVLTIINCAKNFSFQLPKIEESNITYDYDVDSLISNQVVTSINNQLKENGFSAHCLSVELVKDQDTYKINSLKVNLNESPYDDTVIYLSKLTGIPKEQIYV